MYDLSVLPHQCYLANGLLVSNSDAFLGLAVGVKRAMDAVEGAGPAGDIETDTGAGLIGLNLDDDSPIATPYEMDYEF